jgi:hypothetical protein
MEDTNHEIDCSDCLSYVKDYFVGEEISPEHQCLFKYRIRYFVIFVLQLLLLIMPYVPIIILITVLPGKISRTDSCWVYFSQNNMSHGSNMTHDKLTHEDEISGVDLWMIIFGVMCALAQFYGAPTPYIISLWIQQIKHSVNQ